MEHRADNHAARQSGRDSVHESGAGMTRREFVSLGLLGGAALAIGSPVRLDAASTSVPRSATGAAAWLEKSIPELQARLVAGEFTSSELTAGYLERIADLNPLLHAVIETNPEAQAIAAALDAERASGNLRGLLHGIPILLKDNIATADAMETTAGSLALVGSRVPADAPLVARLRAAGAVILGKANLSEWANFRGSQSINGWSARGGFTRNPYVLSYDPCGSSSGSAVAAAANLCAAAIGTETDGSIVCPSGNNLIVGLKPTVGLVSQRGIIPISHSQDSAGPMARTVTDVAVLLSTIRTPSGAVRGHRVPRDYTVFLRRGTLDGARIGVDRRYFRSSYGASPAIVAKVEEAMQVMQDLGATLVDTDSADVLAFSDDELTVLLFEFKAGIARYLGGLENTSLRTLTDLIAFNDAHCTEEMKYFGQQIFKRAEATSGDLTDPEYRGARQRARMLTRTAGIDAALVRDNLDAIIAPSYTAASAPAAVAGYPIISLPIGLRPDGKPAGLWMYAGFLQEPKLIALAYDLEQEMRVRRMPTYSGTVPSEPRDAGFCHGSRQVDDGTGPLEAFPFHPDVGRPAPGR